MGVVLFIAASGMVAVRLLFLYARTKQPPELFLGLAYLLAGTLGWGGLLVGVVATPPGQSLREAYQAWSVVLGDLGTLGFYLFVWYIFRRTRVLAKAAVAVAGIVFMVSIVADTLVRGVTFGPPPGTLTTQAGIVARAAVFAWMSVEAISSYFAFRKRARIGLGNPLVANRLLLWGISALLALTLSVTSATLFVMAKDQADATAKQNQAGAWYGLLAAGSAIALWLAFFPPRIYRQWVEGSPEGPSNG